MAELLKQQIDELLEKEKELPQEVLKSKPLENSDIIPRLQKSIDRISFKPIRDVLTEDLKKAQGMTVEESLQVLKQKVSHKKSRKKKL